MEPKTLQQEFGHTVATVIELEDQIRVLDKQQREIGINLSCLIGKKKGLDMDKNESINKKQEVKAQLQASQEKLQNFHIKGQKKNSKKMLKSRDSLIELKSNSIRLKTTSEK